VEKRRVATDYTDGTDGDFAKGNERRREGSQKDEQVSFDVRGSLPHFDLEVPFQPSLRD
jgi:hypothetical protein